jgi:type IV secretion system protein VirD4
MKRKSFFAIFLGIIGTITNIYFSTLIHLMLNKQFKGILTNFNNCIHSLASNEKHWMLFLCFEIFILLAIALMNITKFKEFSSSIIKVTPDIRTPIQTGNFEHGSSRWLKKSEYKKVFGSYVFLRWDKRVKDIIKKVRKIRINVR